MEQNSQSEKTVLCKTSPMKIEIYGGRGAHTLYVMLQKSLHIKADIIIYSDNFICTVVLLDA